MMITSIISGSRTDSSFSDRGDLSGIVPQVNPDWATLPLFDRKGWKTVRFGDVVENLNETCDPRAAGVERFIGLEHLDPGVLHIRAWGNVADGTTFTRRCRPGQVLFGKRRAYQRKVAVAEFDAVVSGDIYLLAPSSDRLLPDLLPFLCLSQRFFEHAVGTSAGSLSPRTNWSSLASFEFALPTIDQQRRIAETLWALDECLVSIQNLLTEVIDAKKAIQSERFISHRDDCGWHAKTLNQVTQRISVGLATSITNYYRPIGVPLIRNQNIRPLHLDDRDLLFLEPKFANQFESKKLKARDVITTRTGSNIGQTCLVPDCYAGAHSFTTVIVTCNEEQILPEYLVQHMNADIGVREIERLSTTGGKGNLNVSALAAYRIDVPTLAEQNETVRLLQGIDSARAKIRACLTATQALRDDFLRAAVC